MGQSGSTKDDKPQTNALLFDKSTNSANDHKGSPLNASIELDDKREAGKPSKTNANRGQTKHITQRRHSSFSLPKKSKLKSKLKLKFRARTMSMNNIDKFLKYIREKSHTKSEKGMYTNVDPESRTLTITECSTRFDEFILISDTSDEETSNNESDATDIEELSLNPDGYVTNSEESVGIDKLWVFNMCLWTNDEIAEFLKLIGAEIYNDTFKANAMNLNTLITADEKTLISMNIPKIDCERIIKARDWFMKCNRSIQTLMNLNVSYCDENRLRNILRDIKSVLNEAKPYRLRANSNKTIFECKHEMMVKIVKNHISQIESQLNIEK